MRGNLLLDSAKIPSVFPSIHPSAHHIHYTSSILRTIQARILKFHTSILHNIKIYHEYEGVIESVLRITPFAITRLAEWWQTVIMREGFFYPILTWIIPLNTPIFSLKRFQKFLNRLRCDMTWWCHLTTVWRDFQYNQCTALTCQPG